MWIAWECAAAKNLEWRYFLLNSKRGEVRYRGALPAGDDRYTLWKSARYFREVFYMMFPSKQSRNWWNDVFYVTLNKLAHEKGCSFSAESVAPTIGKRRPGLPL